MTLFMDIVHEENNAKSNDVILKYYPTNVQSLEMLYQGHFLALSVPLSVTYLDQCS